MYDVFFLSYDESSADQNYQHLKSICPLTKRVHGIKGILNAHKQCALKSNTEYFWVVDADSKVKPYFKFDYTVDQFEQNFIHVWRAENPVNGLVYGYGAIKLLPKDVVLKRENMHSDMTTSLGTFKIMHVLASITCFNTSPFNTWRAAFRECTKLASKTIHNQKDVETELRLNTWCTVAYGDYAEYCLDGANKGREFGLKHTGSLELQKINDFDWLKEQFNGCIK